MIYSANELMALIQKAAIGSGLPHGMAEDFALSALTIAPYGLDSAKAALEGLMHLDQSGFVVAKDGLALFDQMVAEAMLTPELKPVSKSLLVDHPQLFLGMALHTAHHYGLSMRLSFGTHQCTINAMGLEGGADLKAAPCPCEVESLGFLPQPISWPLATTHEIDAETFAALQARAHRTYVPASEASRLKGAGAGLTDND